MSDIPFYRTQMGHRFYEATAPSIARELARRWELDRVHGRMHSTERARKRSYRLRRVSHGEAGDGEGREVKLTAGFSTGWLNLATHETLFTGTGINAQKSIPAEPVGPVFLGYSPKRFAERLPEKSPAANRTSAVSSCPSAIFPQS